MAFWAWNFGAPAQPPRAKAEPEEGTRQLWNNEFRRLRPSAPLTAKAVPGAGDAMVGVTIWRLRESRPQDDKEVRIPAGDAVKEWTPVRIAADTTLSEGQKVRVAIESARSGYLYVIDREQYADGAFGAPYLLFPVLRVRGGNNKVAAGRLIEIPGPEDNPRHLTMRMSRPDQVAEVLILLVTPNPLPDLKIERNPIQLSPVMPQSRGPLPVHPGRIGLRPVRTPFEYRPKQAEACPTAPETEALLSPAQVQAWEKKWGAKVERLEARRQLGKPYTRAEKQAAQTETRLLTYEEPLPQTMYRLQVKPGDPLLVKVPLRIAK